MFIISGSLVLICFQSRQMLSWNFVVLFSTFHWLKKNVEIYCFCFASWLVNFARVTNYMPPYPYPPPPRVEVLCIGIISVLIQVMCCSQMLLSIGTQLSFWHLFDKFLIRFETGQSDFQNKCEHVIRNIACLFVKFQSWKWTGVCENARKSILAINKFFPAQIFAKFNFFLSKRFFQNSVVLKLLILSLLHLIHEWNWTKLVKTMSKT